MPDAAIEYEDLFGTYDQAGWVQPSRFLDDAAGVSRRGLAVVFGGLLAANALAWLWACTAFSHHPALLGLALIAWMFGLRHAMDADHIAAIDNVVRKLMQEGKRPVLAGGFFSLGHSAVVVAASAALALSASALQGRLLAWRDVGGTIGTAISAAFLLLIALLNVTILYGIWRRFRAASRGGSAAPEEMDALLAGGSLLTRLLRPVLRAVSRSWQMFPLGLLFGLGFDTATEIGLLGLSATQAAQGLPPWQIMVFPALFTAGMVLVDTADSALMVAAYGWALDQPVRKLWYNLTITTISVVVALLVGGVEAIGLLADRFQLRGRVWAAVAHWADFGANAGFAIVAAVLAIWLLSAALYRWRRGTRSAVAPLPGK